jgi:hypothetical protein
MGSGVGRVMIAHRDCGPAFFYAGRPTEGRPLDLSLICLFDGSVPWPDDPIVCGTCGHIFRWIQKEPE